MRRYESGFTLLGLLLLASAAPAASIDFDTQSTAVQTITSDLADGGSAVLNAVGTQHFTIDPSTGFANVTSDFHGDDFATIAGVLSYDLYNTATVGTVTESGGVYTVHYDLLFELKITTPDYAGIIFETKDNAVFETTTNSIPFPPNTIFSDPNSPNDGVNVYLKADPNGILAALGINIGDPVGTSSSRTVTVLNAIPEPASLSLLGIAAVGLIGVAKMRAARARR